MFLPFGTSGGGAVTWGAIGNAAGNLSLSNAGFTTTFNQTSAVVWTWANTTVATNSTTNASPLIEFAANYNSGTAGSPVSSQDLWTIGSSLAAGPNGASTLTLAHSGSTGNAAVLVPGGATTLPGLALGSTSYGFSQSGGTIYTNVGNGGGLQLYIVGGAVQCYLHVNSSQGYAALQSQPAGSFAAISGCLTTATTIPCVLLTNNASGNGGNMAATSGTQVGVLIGSQSGLGGNFTFAPASGSANFVALEVNPTINQTSTASGNYTALLVNVVETSLKGSANKLLDLQAGTTGGTSKFSIDNTGAVFHCAAAGAPTSAGTAGTAGQIIYFGGLMYLCTVTGAAGSATWNKLNMTAV